MDTITRRFLCSEMSFFLFGPRGTGKSTFLRSAYQNAEWINLLDPEMFRLFSAKPERLLEVVRQVRHKKNTIIIDEVQLVPQLLSVVHLLMEEDKSTIFILTGSSARKLKRTGADLLAGRALLRTMHPFIANELGNLFSLETALESGLVPLVVASADPPEILRTYVSLYLQEEVRHEGLVRNIGDFARFLEIMAFSHGAEVNTSNIARECMVGRKAVESYLSIVNDLLLAFNVPPFVKKAERSPRAHSKFYYFDTGIFKSLRPSGPLDRAEEIDGAALEGLIAQHLRAWIAYRNTGDCLYYWRTYDGAEVDFVVYGPQSFVAIEVKNAGRIRREDFKGLRSFSEKYPQASCVLLYRGNESALEKNVHCLPVEQFLRQLQPQKSLTEII
jgi:predicted AAA+ superfamily ATPase